MKKETYRFSWTESSDEMHVMLGEDTWKRNKKMMSLSRFCNWEVFYVQALESMSVTVKPDPPCLLLSYQWGVVITKPFFSLLVHCCQSPKTPPQFSKLHILNSSHFKGGLQLLLGLHYCSADSRLSNVGSLTEEDFFHIAWVPEDFRIYDEGSQLYSAQ